MSLVNIRNTQPRSKFSIFEIGFRPFFIFAALYSVIAIFYWIFVYQAKIRIDSLPLTSFQWHAHEMIFGYAMAVIAGFLLTAMTNWTGLATLNGNYLKTATILWLVPRLLFLFGTKYLAICFIFDMLFSIVLIGAVLLPVIKTKQWLQLGIVIKLMMLGAANLVFYLGALSFIRDGIYIGIYAALYLIVSLVLTIGARVMPGFIMNGVGYKIVIKVPKWISLSSLILFVLFFINQLFLGNQLVLFFSSFLLFGVNLARLYYWHTPGIWKKPLLWGLFLSICFITFGFLLVAASAVSSPGYYSLAIHAFAYGGIGLSTLSMMSRVSLGHTGRNIHHPEKYTALMLLCLSVGTFVRIILPIFQPNLYVVFILVSQVLWILSFSLFLISYSPILFRRSLT